VAQIQRAGLSEKLRRAFSIISGSVGSTISDELVGVILVDDVAGPDTIGEGYPARAIGGVSSANLSTFFSKVGFRNPADSGVDMFVEAAIVSIATTSTVTLRTGPLPAGAVDASRGWRDFRRRGAPACDIWSQNLTVSSGAPVSVYRMLQDTPYLVPLEMTLPPGNATVVWFQHGATNQEIRANFYWVERPTIGQ